jgi:hypothetical protein
VIASPTSGAVIIASRATFALKRRADYAQRGLLLAASTLQRCVTVACDLL